MKLFALLCSRKVAPGHIWRGKNRIYKEVTPLLRQDLKDKLELEEKNMFYLRHSYLTLEQSMGHAKALGKNQRNYVKTLTKKKEYYPSVSVESRLSHLRYNEQWD